MNSRKMTDDVAEGFELRELLGSGGMGRVWRARHATFGRDVAIKFLADRNDPEARELFRREACSTHRAFSPHTTKLLEARLDAEHPCLILDYVRGTTLSSQVKRAGALPFPVVVDLVRKISASIQAVHDAGVVHRDVKAENILVDDLFSADPRLTLVDFGLARHKDDVLLPSDQRPSFTPYATSPEQVLSPLENDPRCDVWSLGVLAYVLLTGKRPFGTGDMLATLIAIEESSWLPVSANRRELGDGANQFFRTAFAMKRDARFLDVRSFVSAFEETFSDLAPASGIRAVRAPANTRATRTPEFPHAA